MIGVYIGRVGISFFLLSFEEKERILSGLIVGRKCVL